MNANDYASILENQGHKYIADFVRQQQAEIEFLKKEILEKHEDWKHEGQQAANARAEIDKVNAEWVQATTALVNAVQEIHGKQAEIEALKADKALHDEAYLSQMKEIEALKIKLAEAIDAEKDRRFE